MRHPDRCGRGREAGADAQRLAGPQRRPRGERGLRVAVLCLHACPLGTLGTRTNGGMSVYVRELSEALGRMGHTLDIYTGVADEGHPAAMRLAEAVRLVHLRPPGGTGAGSREEVLAGLDGYAEQLQGIREREGLAYDLVHSHYWLSGLLGERLSRAWRVPHVLMFHTLGSVKNRSLPGLREPPARLEAERRVARSSTRLLAATQAEKQLIARECGVSPDRIGLVSCGVNLDRFPLHARGEARERLGFGEAERVLLFVGRFDPIKGIDRLVAALAGLARSKGVRLVLVGGDGPDSPETLRLERLAREKGVEERVRFAGRVAQGELPAYYAAADVLVHPSASESFGLVALEALACGTPVLATAVGAMEALLRDGSRGRLIPDASPAGLARSISEFLRDLERRPPSPERLRDSVRPFCWDGVARQVSREYARALGPGGAHPEQV